MRSQRALVAVVVIGVAGTSWAQVARPPPKDTTNDPTTAPFTFDETGLRDAVKSELSSIGFPADTMRIDVDDGRVTLGGSVESFADRARAEDAVARLRGVTEVRNNLQVTAPQVSDASLKAGVESALRADPATDEYAVTITATNGKVRLSGAVDSWAEKMLAGRIAGRVAGVRDVDNQLGVRPPALRNNAALTEDVKQRLRFDARLDDSRVIVSADAGKVTLSGAVNSIFEKTAAIGHTYAAGARNVDAGKLRIENIEDAEATAREKFSEARDETIEAALKATLAVDPRIKGESIEVDVKKGTATLTGTVTNFPAERAALEDARAIAGVRQVDDRLIVKIPTPAGDKALRDSVLAAVQRERGIEAGEVAASVDKGRVTLRGNVDSNDERMRAVEAAALVPGVVSVDDRLGIERGKTAAKSDKDLESAVRTQLVWSPYVDADEVRISVKDGTVTLTGDVDSWFEKDQATENALQAGAFRVNNRLKVEPPPGNPSRCRRRRRSRGAACWRARGGSMPNYLCDSYNEGFERLADYARHVSAAHPGRAVFAVDVADAAAGLSFPCAREKVVAHAESRLASDDERLALLASLPAREFKDAADVALGLSEVKHHQARRSLQQAAAGIEPVLGGAPFPATRDALIERAERMLAPDDLRLRVLRSLPSRTFERRTSAWRAAA